MTFASLVYNLVMHFMKSEIRTPAAYLWHSDDYYDQKLISLLL